MNIIIAENSGFCNGVKLSVKKAYESLKNNKDAYSLGPIVHNPQQVKELEDLGLSVISEKEVSDIKDSTIVTRAHGVKEEVKKDIVNNNNILIDATCPVLLNIYKTIQNYEKKGYKVIIVGDCNHPEIIAMASFANNSIIINDEKQAKNIMNASKLFVVSQTTNRFEHFNNIAKIIEENNKDVVVKNTICNATKDRQKSCKDLSKRVDCMIVVGGFNSSNTNKLYQIANTYCKNVFRIETVKDLPLQKLSKFYTIGIIAGASTPDKIIEEVVSRMDNLTNEEFMNSIEDSMKKIYPRDIVKGSVINVKDDEIFVDIQYRADGIVKLDEMTDEQKEDPKAHFNVGDEVDVYVIKLDDGEGNVSLSTRRVEGMKNWQKLLEEFDNNETIEAKITGYNKGGLTCQVHGINGFIPASHIATYYVKNFKKFVGETWQLQILSVDERKRRLVLSRKDVIEEKLEEQWDKLEEGQDITGKVARLTDFGAFVEIGDLDGLLHVSDISWNRISKPSDVLNVGDEIEVKILKLNKEKNRISLGLKQLQERPFEKYCNEHEIGETVKGKVVNLLNFGAFVELAEGVEGLIHVSEISWLHVEKPSDELNIGDEVEVKILSIDKEEQRIGLSIKALKPEPKRPERKPRKKVNRPKRTVEKKQDDSFGDEDLHNNLGLFIEQQLEANKNEEE
ncbi:MAG: bifunctional 4-hydroxy-3-methylbut-2-enyl diphosphate reductase/30S ribosomal protein S1 [Tissierellia bacterium]|nr:bifunctional 4-hydroxy-3-methylbut-2-enyl diphosphate reductase/30S ribosomal protein S1 [Tissierellia bacterium]